MENLSDAIVSPCTLNKSELEADYGNDGKTLMRFGAATEFTEFFVVEGSITYDGRKCVEIASAIGGTTFATTCIVEGGDSSAPVVDVDGVMHGMISAKSVYTQMAYMITKDIVEAGKKLGFDMELA